MTKFNNKQLEELHKYSSAYSKIQETAKKFYLAKSICETFSDRPVAKDADICLSRMAMRLREAIQNYRKDTPAELQEIFDWGKPLSSLESLATNQLLKG